MASISDLLAVHNDLDELFFAHQTALLRFDFAKAVEELEAFELSLVEHMRDEEEILLPAYSALGNISGAGAPRFFYDDHQKMRFLVTAFKQRTCELSFVHAPERGLLQLLDRQAFFKRLCGHHDKRESEHLYRLLDAQLPAAKRDSLLEKIRTRTCTGAVA